MPFVNTSKFYMGFLSFCRHVCMSLVVCILPRQSSMLGDHEFVRQDYNACMGNCSPCTNKKRPPLESKQSFISSEADTARKHWGQKAVICPTFVQIMLIKKASMLVNILLPYLLQIRRKIAVFQIIATCNILDLSVYKLANMFVLRMFTSKDL